MKLVMMYTDGDGCTYSCDTALPIEYESAEAAIVEFERLAREARGKKFPESSEFKFCGHSFHAESFIQRTNTTTGEFKIIDQFYAPDFLTIDEWFAQANQ